MSETSPRADRSLEVCICAAIVSEDCRVFRGHRHDDAILTAGKAGAKPSSLAASQGFITSRNRFVDRYEGMRLQRAAGARSACYGELRGDMLFSEDLYFGSDDTLEVAGLPSPASPSVAVPSPRRDERQAETIDRLARQLAPSSAPSPASPPGAAPTKEEETRVEPSSGVEFPSDIDTILKWINILLLKLKEKYSAAIHQDPCSVCGHRERELRALIEQWREEAASQGAIYGSGIAKCADELEAALRPSPSEEK